MGADIHVCSIRGISPLGATAWCDQHRVAQLLIDHGADVNHQDSSGETALFRACANVSNGVAETLLENGADITIQTYEHKLTPLMVSLPSSYQLEVRKRTMTEMISLTKLIISHTSDLNAVQADGRTALHIAVARNELYGACLLVEQGCDLEIRDKEGLTPLHLAIQPVRPQYEMALFLLLYGADVNKRFTDRVCGKEILPLTMVLKTRPDNERVQKHRTRLLNALIPATDLSRKGIIEVLETMLGDIPVPQQDINILKYFNVNQPCSLQGQCRHVIRKSLGQQILKKIEALPIGWQMKQYVSLGLDYRRFHPLSACIMHVSVLDGDTDRVQSLLQEGCDINIPLGDKIPLTLAAQEGHVDAVRVLLEYGADPGQLDNDGQSALHAAALNGSDNVVKELVRRKCDVNAVNADGNTPVQEAANMGHFETVMLLLDAGGCSSIVGPTGIPIIHLAAGSGHIEAVRYILDRAEDKNLLDKFGNTPLHVAASRGIVYLINQIRLPALYREEVLEMLDAARLPLMNGFPKYVRSDGVFHLDVIQELLEDEVDRQIQNSDKKLAEDLARTYFSESTKLFESHL